MQPGRAVIGGRRGHRGPPFDLRGDALLRLPTGENVAVPSAHSLLFDARRVLARDGLQLGEGSWASDKPLSWVAEAFRPYLPGVVLLDDSAAKIRVNGLFPLDDMATSLEMLERSLPVAVIRYNDYWVSITASQQPT